MRGIVIPLVALLIGAGLSASVPIPDPVPACAAAPPASAAPAPPGRTHLAAYSPGSADLDIRIDQINTIAYERFPGSVAYLAKTGPTTVTIYETRHDPAFYAAIAALPGYDQLTIIEKHTDLNLTDQTTLMYRLSADYHALAGLGVFMEAWGPGPDRVHVTLVAGTCDGPVRMPPALVGYAQSVFDRRYGPGLIVVEAIGSDVPRAI